MSKTAIVVPPKPSEVVKLTPQILSIMTRAYFSAWFGNENVSYRIWNRDKTVVMIPVPPVLIDMLDCNFAIKDAFAAFMETHCGISSVWLNDDNTHLMLNREV